MTALASSFTLRRILGFDALTCFAVGLICLAGAAWLEGQLAIPAGILRGSGLVMLGCAAFIGWLASRASPPRPLVWLVIAGNVLWALESLISVVSGWLQPNAAGTAFVIGQALAVLLIAELEYIALRREPRAA